nr:MAG TPA: hypothetical protein [Bacteriophage sp.]
MLEKPEAIKPLSQARNVSILQKAVSTSPQLSNNSRLIVKPLSMPDFFGLIVISCIFIFILSFHFILALCHMVPGFAVNPAERLNLLLRKRAFNRNGNGVKHIARNSQSVFIFGLNVQNLPFGARFGVVQGFFNLFCVKNTVKLLYHFTRFNGKIIVETCILYTSNGTGLYRATHTSGALGLVIDGARNGDNLVFAVNGFFNFPSSHTKIPLFYVFVLEWDFSLFPFPLYNYIITYVINNTMQFCCKIIWINVDC